MDVIVEIILIGLLVFPGALIRWTISRLWRSKRKLKEFLDDDAYLNGTIGILVLGFIIWGFFGFKIS